MPIKTSDHFSAAVDEFDAHARNRCLGIDDQGVTREVQQACLQNSFDTRVMLAEGNETIRGQRRQTDAR